VPHFFWWGGWGELNRTRIFASWGEKENSSLACYFGTISQLNKRISSLLWGGLGDGDGRHRKALDGEHL